MTTPNEVLELRCWSAEVLMGWILSEMKYLSCHPVTKQVYYGREDGSFVCWVEDWHPDDPESPVKQILMVVERMRELGWHLSIRSKP